MTLRELAASLRELADGIITPAELQARLDPVLGADPLDVAASDATPWEENHHDERLFWRIIYLFESDGVDDPRMPDTARHIVDALERTGSAQTTLELLPVILDQARLCTIVARHVAGVISRTGFLSVVAESGYPDHMKLWLQHASYEALARLCERLADGRYDAVAAAFEMPPD
jgi:hypothetical protein